MSADDSHIVAMPGFTLVLRITVLVLSILVLSLAANSVAVTHNIYAGYDQYYSGDVPGAIKYSSMGFVIFVVRSSGVES